MSYSKEVWRSAWKIMNARRSDAQQQHAARTSQLYKDVPRLSEIERELSQTGLMAAKTALSGKDDVKRVIEILRERNLALQDERKRLLALAGLPETYLEVPYSCKRCEDTGYIGQEQCDCMTLLLRQLASSRLSDSFSNAQECTFENFRLDYYPEHEVEAGGHYSVIPRKAMERVLGYCRSYAQCFHPGSESLLLCGGTGLGKTFLSIAIAKEVAAQGNDVIYITAPKLMERMQARQFSRGPDDGMTDAVSSCQLLIIDDLGAEFSTTFTVSAVYTIINQRMIDGKPTIVNTNLDEDTLRERYGDRVLSRLLCAFRPLQFYGEDIRIIKRFQKI